MRKGQMEIMGFMVIVLLIIIGVILYLSFMGGNDSVDLIQESETNLEVNNMLDVIRMQTVCEGVDGNDVIKSCIGDSFECGEDACELLVEQMDLITNAYGWGNNSYMFSIDGELLTDECFGERLPDDATISGREVVLYYCYD